MTPHRLPRNSGVSLIELLIVIIIGGIATLALSVPFVAERRFWMLGSAQTESQRDAQLALRAIARIVRESSGFNDTTKEFTIGCGTVYFEKHDEDGSLHLHGCLGTRTLIDGALSKSKVQAFTVTSVSGNPKLVDIQIDVIHNGQANELLDTQLFLRNA